MSTYSKMHFHVVFSTQHRVACIDQRWRQELWAYMAGTINGLGGHARNVGGWKDHVHILADLKPTQTVADIVREVKKASSQWIRTNAHVPQFKWQDGYAVFTAGWRELGPLANYINNQEEHHRHRTFIEELTTFLEDAGVEFDPKYLP